MGGWGDWVHVCGWVGVGVPVVFTDEFTLSVLLEQRSHDLRTGCTRERR